MCRQRTPPTNLALFHQAVRDRQDCRVLRVHGGQRWPDESFQQGGVLWDYICGLANVQPCCASQGEKIRIEPE